MTTTPLCFIDTETTGLHPERRAWEIALIRRDDAGERELLIQVRDVDLSNAEPKGLQVGGFYERHGNYAPAAATGPGGPFVEGSEAVWATEGQAAELVEQHTRGAHLVGCVPDFDARTLDPMLRRHGLIPAWHYHLVDVEAMAVGWLSAHAAQPVRWITGADPEKASPADFRPGRLTTMTGAVEVTTLTPDVLSPPWRSDDLSRACGVEPPSDEDRHTAMGDARWAMRWYDAIVGGVR